MFCNRRTALLAVALFLSWSGAEAQVYSELSAPPFVIDFDPKQVHFEPAPASVYECESLGDRRGLLFVFAKVHRGAADYYLLSGWEKSEGESNSGEPRFENEHDEGILVELSKGSCRLHALGYALSSDEKFRLQAEKTGFSATIVAALIDDAVTRQIRMFGGRDNFLCQPAIANDPLPWPPQLQKKLDELGAPSKPCK